MELAHKRVAQVAGLAHTVTAQAGRIEDYRAAFDIGVAVHACGMATDCAQLQCVARYVLPSRIPSLCTRSTRTGIEWCCCHRAVCMAWPR